MVDADDAGGAAIVGDDRVGPGDHEAGEAPARELKAVAGAVETSIRSAPALASAKRKTSELWSPVKASFPPPPSRVSLAYPPSETVVERVAHDEVSNLIAAPAERGTRERDILGVSRQGDVQRADRSNRCLT